MNKYANQLAIRNPFRLYIYQHEDGHKEFKYSDHKVGKIADDDFSDGYVNIKNIIQLADMAEKYKIRMSPYLRIIDQRFYLENIDIINFEDIVITQPWANNLNDDVKLALSLREEKDRSHRIGESFLLSNLINLKYYIELENGKEITETRMLTIEDIESFGVVIHYFYDVMYSFISLDLENVKFKSNLHVARIIRDDDYNQIETLGIGHYISGYFFGDEEEYPAELIEMEYVLTPAMIFSPNLYEKTKNKIDYIRYDAKRGEESW